MVIAIVVTGLQKIVSAVHFISTLLATAMSLKAAAQSNALLIYESESDTEHPHSPPQSDYLSL